MFGGFYTATSGLLMGQRTINVLSNNIANVQTPGYRVRRLTSETFEQELARLESNVKTPIGTGAAARIVREVPTLFDASFLESTERPFDMAINGEGYFNIQGKDDVYYTRNGNFDIDEEGFMILRGIGRVLGENGEIEVKGSDFTVKPNGEIYNRDGKIIDKMKISEVPSENLDKMDNGMFMLTKGERNEDGTMTNPEESVTASKAAVYQGIIERSNIDLNREYTMIIEAQRALQSCSVIMKGMDNINQKAANDIGRV